MKTPIIFAIAVATLAGCAMSPYTPPPNPPTRAVSESKLPPKAATQCIAQQWANAKQQTVMMQYMLANDQAFDVYVPGQQPPNGEAAIVRQSAKGTGSWIGYRGSDSSASAAINQCLG
ncbi:hypothetical protein [Cupriavidus pampae]|uniref:Lipoprotein n=1 Tax=Cupriavidus pampae TaxID=659251 RepID=A0ABN7Z2A6_9BURK|nr:hypothetical protein [Cupriavidus pampae]CAG9180050.1 hypothetical protein LMG32289_04483 [Cupriavidus pampae]